MGRENRQRSRAEDAGGHRALPPVALAAREAKAVRREAGPGLKTVRRLITMTEETMRANDGRAL